MLLFSPPQFYTAIRSLGGHLLWIQSSVHLLLLLLLQRSNWARWWSTCNPDIMIEGVYHLKSQRFLPFTLFCFLFCVHKYSARPSLCGSVDWVPACKPKGRQFNSQSRSCAWVAGLVPSRGCRNTHWCFSPSLSPSLPFSKINK